MKIFYAIQGTGNGHLSRAIQLYPYLKKYGDVDFFISGTNTHLTNEIPVKYKSKGLSLFYKQTGGLDYIKMMQSFSLDVFRDAKSLPVDQYDLVINDFDFVSSLACAQKNVPLVHFGHQASFQSKQTPRPAKHNMVGEFILKNFVKSNRHIGLHFSAYDEHIYNPIIKDEIIYATPINDGHITVYLPQYAIQILEPYLLALKNTHFEVFTKEVKAIQCQQNITYYPINNAQFTSSLIRCEGILTAGGFETPAEAMYMNKKVLSIPIKNHFEQACNAAALEKMGVKVLVDLDEHFIQAFKDWQNNCAPIKLNLTHSTAELVDLLFQTTLN